MSEAKIFFPHPRSRSVSIRGPANKGGHRLQPPQPPSPQNNSVTASSKGRQRSYTLSGGTCAGSWPHSR